MYAKVFARITESSLMEEEIPVRYTFVMLLAIADPTGLVVGTNVALARRLNMPLAEFEKCIKALQQEDHDSNSKEEGGKRIVPSDGERGYQIVNYLKYRNIKDEEEKRAYMRDYMRARRAREAVKACKTQLTDVTQAEAEAEASVHTRSVEVSRPSLKEVLFAAEKMGLAAWKAQDWFDEMEGCNWRDYNSRPIVKWLPVLTRICRKWEADGRPTGPKTYGSKTNVRSNPRNDGIAIGPTDYGEAAKRKLERQALEAANRAASEAQGT